MWGGMRVWGGGCECVGVGVWVCGILLVYVSDEVCVCGEGGGCGGVCLGVGVSVWL